MAGEQITIETLDCFANLGLEYVDLYLIHFPLKLIQEEFKVPVPNECIAAIDIKAVWEGMEECQNLGLTKSIGVSNFSSKRIQQILSEWHPCNRLLPLGAVGNRTWGHTRVMECDVLQDIAESKGKTVAQISLRWLYDQGVVIAVKSFNTERMKENLDIFDWCLTKEELNKIDQIPQRRHVYLIGSIVIEHNDVLAEIDADLD
ncbi:hypothetical protein L1987_16125 [Smallanthus sonchifolius]|uniref:Uncharacterized protein n=1 Tax=Smallanthus sonchifolius TaxID=185202 RepID=A0ACB9J7C8_9ASTR|nr:hypothetical protein L1987_16125 [Smallanthus sonchifolius]